MAANQNVTQLTQQTGSAAASSLFYAVTGGTVDTGLPLSVLINNLGLTGTPTVPTPGTNIATTQIANTAWVQTFYAPLASPTFTGTPTLPAGTVAVTQTAGNSSTAVATTAFVATSFAPLASPTFTGTPLAPTASTGTSSTQIATTAFIANTFAIPPALGSTTPSSVAATTLTASGAVSGAGFVALHASPGPIGSTTASTGAFTTLSASSTVSGVGFSNYLLTPPPIGTTTPAAGKFTSLATTGTYTPSTTAGIAGTTLADNANTGSIGEYLSGTVTAFSLTSAVTQNVMSLSLAAGDWDVSGVFIMLPAGSTTVSTISAGITTTSAVMPGVGSGQAITLTIPFTTGAIQQLALPTVRINISTTTTVFLVSNTGFAVSTATADGQMWARRRR